MSDFNLPERCPKCGKSGSFDSPQWHAKGSNPTTADRLLHHWDEHIDWECFVCGYNFVTPPLDAAVPLSETWGADRPDLGTMRRP